MSRSETHAVSHLNPRVNAISEFFYVRADLGVGLAAGIN